MCPAESSNILLFLEPPQPYRPAGFLDPAGVAFTRYERGHSLESETLRVRPHQAQSARAVHFRSLERRYPELVTIRPILRQEYFTHSIQFGRRPLTKEEGSAGIRKRFSTIDAPEFAYGALFTVNIYVGGKKKRVAYFPPIRQPKPQKHHLTKALINKLEDMASEIEFELAARSYSEGSLKSRGIGPEEKRNSLHKLMLAQHENAIDSSEDEDDEGGIPAWVAMRHSLYAKRMISTDQEAKGPSSACVTGDPSRRNSASVCAGYNNKDNDQDTIAYIERGSESSGERNDATPTETETELQPSSYQDNERPSPPKFSVSASTWDAQKSDESDSYEYVEYYSGSCKVMRGGFVHAKENIRPKVLSEPFRTFPPLSNRGYMLTSTGHDPKFVHRAEPTNSTFIPRSCIKASLFNSKPTTVPKPLVVPLPAKDPNAEDQWVDSDGEISEASSTGGIRQFYSSCTVFMLCRKCGKHHIPPGSFLSLGRRDTCGSYLPDWFPAEDFEDPWQSYTDLINEIHRLESLERGYTALPTRWDKVYHEEHPVWKALGHRGGGWWRCRTGPNVPQAERKCRECHVNHPPEVLHPNVETMDSAMRTLGQLRNLCRAHMDRVGQKDKAIALDMIRDTMQTHTSLLPPNLHTLGIGWAAHDKREHEEEQEQPPMTVERMVLEAIWNHQGPISTLDIPFPPTFGFSVVVDGAEERVDEEEDEDKGLTMKTTTRRRPPPLSLHRQTSSLGTNFFSSLLSPKSPLSPLSPGIPKEEMEVIQEQMGVQSA